MRSKQAIAALATAVQADRVQRAEDHNQLRGAITKTIQAIAAEVWVWLAIPPILSREGMQKTPSSAAG